MHYPCFSCSSCNLDDPRDCAKLWAYKGLTQRKDQSLKGASVTSVDPISNKAIAFPRFIENFKEK